MRARVVTMLVGLAVAAAACGGGGSETVVAGGEALAAPLAYEYVGGEQLTYAFTGSVNMQMTGEGSGVVGAGASAGDMDASIDVAGEFTISTADGEEPGTTELAISMDVASFEVNRLEMAGEDMTAAADGFVDQSGFDFPDTVIVLDAQGNVVSVNVGGEELPAALAAASGSFGPAGAGLDPALFFNPSFPAGELTVGSQWETVDSMDMPGMGRLSVQTTNRVTETHAKDGHDLFLIESASTMPSLEIDLFDMMGELAAADPAAASEFGDMGSLFPPGMEMNMALVPGEITGSTWFDATSGMVAHSQVHMPLDMTMEMVVPGEGEAKMNVSMDMTFDLTFKERTRTS